MVIEITKDDISWAQVYDLDEPLTHAIARQAGGLWYVVEDEIAYEMVWPYRNLPLPAEVTQYLETFHKTKDAPPLEAELEEHFGPCYCAGAD
jgi:predicted ATP-grasp superfamily ATP-dependent carboligase